MRAMGDVSWDRLDKWEAICSRVLELSRNTFGSIRRRNCAHQFLLCVTASVGWALLNLMFIRAIFFKETSYQITYANHVSGCQVRQQKGTIGHENLLGRVIVDCAVCWLTLSIMARRRSSPRRKNKWQVGAVPKVLRKRIDAYGYRFVLWGMSL